MHTITYKITKMTYCIVAHGTIFNIFNTYKGKESGKKARYVL